MKRTFFILNFDDLTEDARQQVMEAFKCSEEELRATNPLSIVVLPNACRADKESAKSDDSTGTRSSGFSHIDCYRIVSPSEEKDSTFS
jgi:hypothetical protein